MLQRRLLFGVLGTSASLQAREFCVRAFSAVVPEPTSVSFSSQAAPGFDVFQEGIVGSWYSHEDKEECVDGDNEWLVEEVMRSCGGAVQGIREMPLGVYLNRADDGFLFLNDGAYSAGPVKWDPKTVSSDVAGSNNSPPLFLTCMPLDSSTRIVFSSTGESHCTDSNSTAILLTKRGKESRQMTCEASDISAKLHKINWQTHSRCRMPSTSMPWMLQRAKWETWSGDNESVATQRVDMDADTCSLRYFCTHCLSIEDAQTNFGLPRELWTEGSEKSGSGNAAVSVTLVSHETQQGNSVHQSVTREYFDGTLVNVVWSCGQSSDGK